MSSSASACSAARTTSSRPSCQARFQLRRSISASNPARRGSSSGGRTQACGLTLCTSAGRRGRRYLGSRGQRSWNGSNGDVACGDWGGNTNLLVTNWGRLKVVFLAVGVSSMAPSTLEKSDCEQLKDKIENLQEDWCLPGVYRSQLIKE